MIAKIYRPTKNAMQSGKARTRQWMLEFEQEQPRINDPIMGWVGSADTKQQVKMRFPTREQAVAYANKQGWEYKVIEPQKPKIIIKSYADNFASR